MNQRRRPLCVVRLDFWIMNLSSLILVCSFVRIVASWKRQVAFASRSAQTVLAHVQNHGTIKHGSKIWTSNSCTKTKKGTCDKKQPTKIKFQSDLIVYDYIYQKIPNWQEIDLNFETTTNNTLKILLILKMKTIQSYNSTLKQMMN